MQVRYWLLEHVKFGVGCVMVFLFQGLSAPFLYMQCLVLFKPIQEVVQKCSLLNQTTASRHSASKQRPSLLGTISWSFALDRPFFAKKY